MVGEMTEIKSLAELKQRLLEIKEMGWIPSKRRHDTGIGKTFEDLLGIKENNIQLPDIGGIEVKSSRSYTSSLVTLITFEPPREYRNVGWTLECLVNNFEKTGDENGGPVFHITVYAHKYTSNTQQFKLDIREIDGKKVVCVVTKKKFNPANPKLPNDVVVCYPVEEILNRIARKLSGCLLVIEAETRRREGSEEFRLKSAKLYSGFSAERFIELVKEGKIVLDIRFGRYPDGRPHNHGTAWRIRKRDILELYAREIDLLGEKIPEDIDCEKPIILEKDRHRGGTKKITDYIPLLLLL
ncbi:MvaI/BcnI family restriction endonuclease [Thermococcus sp. MAR1]|uniref:MvaI/BcnI family restriction endonuclease n=1 Tax=Thermococcus sp. MAR1 TaxID=1638263 RepID=UPI00143AEC49|nr:MvaI/BcnI family restriction endonuclease [Thermococcus sp. MAR1]